MLQSMLQKRQGVRESTPDFLWCIHKYAGLGFGLRLFPGFFPWKFSKEGSQVFTLFVYNLQPI